MQNRDLKAVAQALVLVAVMLGFVAIALWTHGGGAGGTAGAQGRVLAAGEARPLSHLNAGAQRQQFIDELQTLNRRVAGIETALRNGEFSVQITEKPVKGEEKKP
jgi:hypothetical protein